MFPHAHAQRGNVRRGTCDVPCQKSCTCVIDRVVNLLTHNAACACAAPLLCLVMFWNYSIPVKFKWMCLKRELWWKYDLDVRNLLWGVIERYELLTIDILWQMCVCVWFLTQATLFWRKLVFISSVPNNLCKQFAGPTLLLS